MTYTRTRRSSTFSSASDSSGRVSSPSIDPEAWLPQRSAHSLTRTPPVPAFDETPSAIPLLTRSLEPPDLFVTLLHDRGSAYRHSSTRPSPYLTASSLDERRSLARSLTSPVAEHSPSQHCSHVRTTEKARYPVRSSSTRRESTERSMVVKAPKVSKRRAGCSTKNATKSNGKCDVTSQRKRPAAALEVSDSRKRASKVARVDAKANIGLKVDADKVSISSDSETGEEPPRKSGPIKEERPNTMLHHLKLQQPRRPRANSPVIGRASLWGHPKADSPKGMTDMKSDTDLKPDLTHALRETEATDEEIQRLRLDLQSANENIHRLEKEIKKQEANSNLERQNLETKHTRAVEDEKAILGRLTEQVQDVSSKNTRLESELRALQTQRDQERQEHKEEQRRHAEVLDDILKPKPEEKNRTEEIEQVKKDNTRLSAENMSLKAKAASSQNRAMLSPVPSNNSSTDDERKEDNIRKIYIKTKRQYDVLLAATKNLLACTRSMDLSCFGEFGSYIAKLRKSLEVEASAQSQQVQVVFKEDEDVGFGSQGSML